MKTNKRGKNDYQMRLDAFLAQLEDVIKAPREDYLHDLMDTVPFRDLETALMMTGLDMRSANHNHQ